MIEKETAKPTSYAFPAYLRLKKRKEFDRVSQEGGKIKSRWFILLLARNSLSHNRLGIIVSRKVKNAPDRNRLKRLCREAFRLSNPFLPQGFDLVLLPNFHYLQRLKTPLLQKELAGILHSVTNP